MKPAPKKTADAKALLALKQWLKKQGRQQAEWLLAGVLPDAPQHPLIAADSGFKHRIASVLASCIESYELLDCWQGRKGDYFVDYIQGYDDLGKELDKDKHYAVPARVRHPVSSGDADALALLCLATSGPQYVRLENSEEWGRATKLLWPTRSIQPTKPLYCAVQSVRPQHQKSPQATGGVE